MKSTKKKIKGRESFDHAINKFYNRHKDELLEIFGSERKAKANLKADNGVYPVNTDTVNSKNATKVFNNYLDIIKSPNEELTKARREAGEESLQELLESLGKENQRGLHKKFDQVSIQLDKNLGVDKYDRDITLTNYYNVKNSDYVLAHMYINQDTKSEFDYWDYVRKDQIGIDND